MTVSQSAGVGFAESQELLMIRETAREVAADCETVIQVRRARDHLNCGTSNTFRVYSAHPRWCGSLEQHRRSLRNATNTAQLALDGVTSR